MSAAIVPEAAKADMMREILREPCMVRLYVNEIGPNPIASDFVEPEGGGYLPRPIRADNWDLANAPFIASYPRQLFHFTGEAGTVRGYFVTRNSDHRLRWYAPLPGGPMKIVNDGDQISVALNFSLAPPA